MATNAVRIAILGDASRAKAALNDTGNAVDRLGKRTSNAGSLLKGALIGGGILAAASAVTGKFREAADAVRLQNQLQAQTKAVLKSTAGAANVTAKGVSNLSDALERKSLIDAEEIQKGQNLLLTFTNIRNETGKGRDIFNQTTKTLVDMSTALGQDTKASAIQLGKALNDPVKGVTALSKVGVSFTQQQKDQIKTLVESGRTVDAQKVILGELNKEFGGSAAAAAKADGGVKRFRDMVDSAFERVVRFALPIGLKLIGFLQSNLPKAINTAKPWIDRFRSAFDAVRPVLEKVGAFLKANPEAVKAFAITLGVLAGAVAVVTKAVAIFNAILAANPITLVVIAIAALVAGLVLAYKRSETFRNIVQAIGRVATVVFNGVVSVIRTVVSWIADKLGPTFKVVGGLIKGYVEIWSLPIRTVFNVIKNIVTWVKDHLGPAFSAFKEVIDKVAGPIKAPFEALWTVVKKIAEKIKWIIDNIGKVKEFALGKGDSMGVDKNGNPLPIKGPKAGRVAAGGGFSVGTLIEQVQVTVTTSPFTNPVEVGRVVQEALDAFASAGGTATT